MTPTTVLANLIQSALTKSSERVLSASVMSIIKRTVMASVKILMSAVGTINSLVTNQTKDSALTPLTDTTVPVMKDLATLMKMVLAKILMSAMVMSATLTPLVKTMTEVSSVPATPDLPEMDILAKISMSANLRVAPTPTPPAKITMVDMRADVTLDTKRSPTPVLTLTSVTRAKIHASKTTLTKPSPEDPDVTIWRDHMSALAPQVLKKMEMVIVLMWMSVTPEATLAVLTESVQTLFCETAPLVSLALARTDSRAVISLDRFSAPISTSAREMLIPSTVDLADVVQTPTEDSSASAPQASNSTRTDFAPILTSAEMELIPAELRTETEEAVIISMAIMSAFATKGGKSPMPL